MKVGDSVPPKQVRGKPCPRCKSKVFKNFPSGFVIEVSTVTRKSLNGFSIKDDWHCPGCGLWEVKHHDVDSNGLQISSNPDKPTRSNYKSKKSNIKYAEDTSRTEILGQGNQD